MKLVGRLAVMLLLLLLLAVGISRNRSRRDWNECLGQAYDKWDACMYDCEQHPYDSDDRSWCLDSCNTTFSGEYYACENP
jgi:thiamine biosynthesis protein ThiC